MVTATNTKFNIITFIEESRKELSKIFPELQNKHYQVQIKPIRNQYANTQLKANGFYYWYVITVNKNWLDKNPPIEHLQNTIFHELLHSCNECMNHGKRWQNYAQIVNQKYGTHISRTAEYEEYPYKKPKINYELYCPTCKKVIGTRNRITGYIAQGRAICSKCQTTIKIIKKN